MEKNCRYILTLEIKSFFTVLMGKNVWDTLPWSMPKPLPKLLHGNDEFYKQNEVKVKFVWQISYHCEWCESR
jgi:hypothetical protein